jgi:hypothetical protein
MGRIVVGSLFYDNRAAGISRISADVGGEPLWFESSDTELRLSPEGFGSALLVPAMSHGRDLIFEDPVCPVWLENTHKLIACFSKWWGWKPIKIESASAGKRSPAGSHPGGRRYLCFSGGVDSFYSLLTYPEPIDALMMVHGFDIRLDDATGAWIAFEHVRKIASQINIDAVMVRTNYREHPVAGKKYRYSYGGALSGVGHLVNNAGELIISSGFRYDEAQPDGSHWQMDPYWSSLALKIVHYGAHHIKDDKLREISWNPLLRKHLRVCQENFSSRFKISEKFLNCGRCQKCVRALIVLKQQGVIDDLAIFENVTNLDVHLNKVQQCGEYLFKAYDEICRRGVDKKTNIAIRALIRRSRVLNRLGWAGRRGKKAVFQIFRLIDTLRPPSCLLF